MVDFFNDSGYFVELEIFDEEWLLIGLIDWKDEVIELEVVFDWIEFELMVIDELFDLYIEMGD